MLKFVEQKINWLMDWSGRIAAALLIILVLIMAYNVVGRYAFRHSSIGLEELSWHLYAAIFLLGIPFALRTRSHVRVDLLYENFSARNKALVDLVGSLIFLFPFCLVVIWSGWHFTAASYGLGELPSSLGGFINQLNQGIGERSQDPGGLLNRWIIKGVIPFSFSLLLLSAISFFLERLRTFLDSSATANGAKE